MKILDFVKEIKAEAIKELLGLSERSKCLEKTYKFHSGHAEIVTIRGEVIEKAAIMQMLIKDIPMPGIDHRVDAMVYQMEVFPENPSCPMGHFNTQWSMEEPRLYYLNLDLFPAVHIKEDINTMKSLMDKVADQFGKNSNKLREGLDIHYNMDHWINPLAIKAGFKLRELGENDLDLFISAYRTFFDGYLDILKKRKDTPYGQDELRIKLARNGKWLEYIALKDPSIKLTQTKGVQPEVVIDFSYPPSAAF